ncbi:MAG: trypsin-like peptidase domain-containing protein [Planctomycetota bacterium]
MNGKLTIQHLEGSSLAGMSQGYTGPKVTLGTAATAHVGFDADEDPAVVDDHAVVWLEAAGARVEALGGAVVLVNGHRVADSSPLKEQDVIRLGEDGPQMRVTGLELPKADAPTSTVMGGRRGEDPETSAGRRATPPATPPPPGDIAPTIVGKRPSQPIPGQPPPVRVNMGGPGMGGAASSPPAPAPPPTAPKASGTDSFIPEHVKNRPPGAGIGMNTLMGVVESVTKRERGRNTAKLVSVVVVMALLGTFVAGGVYFVTRNKDAPESPPVVRTVKSDKTDWTTVAEEVKPSICIALHRKRGTSGAEQVAGTVWSVGEGLFATNAHVAEIFLNTEIYGGQTPEMIIRTPGAEPKDLRVESVVLHPGYNKWSELLQAYNPYVPSEQSFLMGGLFGACDVALIKINRADWEHQPPYLTLADEERAADIGAGRELATFGYPSEGIQINIIQPEPEGRYGVVSKVGDFFLASAEPEDAEFVWYNWESAGGASGSPVFNTDGEVVSLVSAGNVIGIVGQARISAGGTTLGPHVRFVKELLNDEAREKQQARNAEWERDLQELFTLGTQHTDDMTRMIMIETIIGINSIVEGFFDPEKQVLELVSKTNGVLDITGNQRVAQIDGVKAEPGLCFYIVVATNRPTPITLYPERQRPSQGIQFPGYFYMYEPQNVQQGFVGPVIVEASPDAEPGRTELSVYVYRIIKKPQ